MYTQVVQKCMNNKTDVSKENKRQTSGKTMAVRKKLTPLQTTAIVLLMSLFTFISVSSMITYSSNKRPSEEIFINSQTIKVLNA